jgi:hypothetical protein
MMDTRVLNLLRQCKDALEQWRNAEILEDAKELENARASRDRAIADVQQLVIDAALDRGWDAAQRLRTDSVEDFVAGRFRIE